jgi:sulfate adenylyltransferase subunit 2
MAAGHRIPTILITGGPTPSGRNQALAEGVLSYVPKPLSEEALLDNVRLALARSAVGHGDGMSGSQSSEAGASEPASRTGRPHPRSHLKRLEAESIAILREVAAEFRNPVLMYSIGKDSSVLLHLARKAFYPAKPPFPLLHIDTRWKFREMIAFRDETAKRLGLDLIAHVNQEGVERGIDPISSGSALHTQIMKTEALKQALDKYGFDAAIGGARRDEEKSRAKERIFSFRNSGHVWDPRHQRPELWHLYNTRLRPGESMRVFPLSNWTELDVWQYIEAEGIDVVPLYFAKERPVVQRGGVWIMVDDERLPLEPDERPELRRVRFRTLGCYPLTGAIESHAATVGEIVAELRQASRSERQGRLIDGDSDASMERKKREGYF